MQGFCCLCAIGGARKLEEGRETIITGIRIGKGEGTEGPSGGGQANVSQREAGFPGKHLALAGHLSMQRRGRFVAGEIAHVTS